MGTCKESLVKQKRGDKNMLTNRMKKELLKTGRTETTKYIYRLNEKDSAKLPFAERIDKKLFGTMAYYTEWQRVPVKYGELMK